MTAAQRKPTMKVWVPHLPKGAKLCVGRSTFNLHEFPEVDLCRVGDDACHGKGCLLESGLETGADPAHADIRVMREVNCFALPAGLNTSSGQSCAPPRTRLLPYQQAG